MKSAWKIIALSASGLCLAAISTMPGWAQGEHCAPPPEMKAKLAGTPNADALNDLGVWFADHNDYVCAGEAFATSLQTDPKQAGFRRVIFMFGASLYYTGDMKEAAAALEEAERVGYRDAKLYSLQASALDAQQETEKAEVEWKEALQFDPESAVVLDALSDDMIARHEYSDVVDLLGRNRLQGLRTDRQIRNLGTALVQLSKTEEAAKVLEDGLNTYPESQEMARQLSSVLTILHRDEEAALVLKLAAAQHESAQATGK